MRSWAGAMMATLAISAGAEASEIARSGGTEQGLVLKMLDTYNQFPTGLGVTAAQVVDIFARIGVAVRWVKPSTTVLPEPDRAELIVYLRASRPEEIGIDKRAMGAVLSRSTPQRTLFIFLPTVAKSLGIRLGGMLEAREERELAKALSRVIVHEAFHAIAPELPHARTGLTRAHLTRDFLLKSKPEIEAGSAARFRRELAELVSRPAAEHGDF